MSVVLCACMCRIYSKAYTMKSGNIVSTFVILISIEEYISGADFTVSVLQGEQAVLPCILPSELDDNVTVTWYFWEQELSVGDNVTIEDARFTLYRPYQSDWYLRISNIELRDVGRYRCMVDDSYSSIATLIVESPPEITGYSSDEIFIHICYKARLTLFCNLTGLPRPTITWYKLNDRQSPVPILSDLELYEEMIFIPEVDETSPGVYMCKVTNSHGQTSMKFHVKVIDLMTIIEPARKTETPRQIVHAPSLSNAQESTHLVKLNMTLYCHLLTFIILNFIHCVQLA